MSDDEPTSTDQPEQTEADHTGPVMVTMSIAEAQASLDDLIDRIQGCTRIVLTVPDGRRAVLVGWGWYAQQQERLAMATAAYWRAWRTGVFDSDSYATELRAAGLHPQNTPEPGNGDVDAATAGGA